jgi:hypothetical protein
MVRGRQRWLLRLMLLGLGGLVLFLWTSWNLSARVLTIENRSEQPIASLRVRLAGATSTFQNVPPRAEVAAQVGSNMDEPSYVDVQLADGTLSRQQFPSLRNAMNGGRARLVVLPGGGFLVPRQDAR